MGTTQNIPHPYVQDLDRAWMIRLKENSLDLEAELSDLAMEIEWRVDRVVTVRRQLADTRRQLAEARAA